MSNVINYQQLLNDSMILLIKKVLSQIQMQNSLGSHYFYISFKTNYPGVKISKRIKNKYKQEITIVLQHQFEHLRVYDHKFSVKISFDGVPESIEVPFNSLTAFADPSMKFGIELQLPHTEHSKQLNLISSSIDKFAAINSHDDVPYSFIESNNIILLDKFRKSSNKFNKIS